MKKWKTIFLIILIIIFLILGLIGFLYLIQKTHGGFIENI